MKEQEFEQIIKQAVIADKSPKEEWNRRIIMKWGGTDNKKRKQIDRKKKVSIVIAASLGVLLISVTGTALSRYLTGQKAAEYIHKEEARKAFEKDDKIMINETQEANGYRFTLLEIANGETICREREEYEEALNDLNKKTSYILIGIEWLEGVWKDSEQAAMETDFFISPLVQGLKPWLHNIASFEGNRVSALIDGIYYCIIECETVEKFADREVYLCIGDHGFASINDYYYDEKSGEISRKEDYQGINLLFSLPLDKSKADPKAVKEYLKQEELSEVLEQDKEKEKKTKKTKKTKKKENNIPIRNASAGFLGKKLTARDIRKRAKLDKKSIQELEKAEDGCYYYQDNDIIYCFQEDDIFEKKTGWSKLVDWYQDDKIRTYILCCRDKKGIVTVYQYKEKASIHIE